MADAIVEAAILKGRLFDDHGRRMTPSCAVKQGLRYRYYQSIALIQGGRGRGFGVTGSAPEVEKIVVDAIRRTFERAPEDTSDHDLVRTWLDRAIIPQTTIEIRTVAEEGGAPRVVTVPFAPKARPRREVLTTGDPDELTRAIRSDTRNKM